MFAEKNVYFLFVFMRSKKKVCCTKFSLITINKLLREKYVSFYFHLCR